MNTVDPVLHLGFSNYLLTDKILGIFDATTRQAQKIIKEHPNVFDTTRNKKCQSYVLCQGNVLIKCHFKTNTLIKRINNGTWITQDDQTSE